MTLAMEFATYAALVAGLTALGIEGMRRWGSRRLLDVPNERSSHTRPTPRGGGLPLIVVALAVWVWTQGVDGMLGAPASLALVIGAVIVALVSWIDDLQGLPFRNRLTVHLLAAAMVLWSAAPPSSAGRRTLSEEQGQQGLGQGLQLLLGRPTLQSRRYLLAQHLTL